MAGFKFFPFARQKSVFLFLSFSILLQFLRRSRSLLPGIKTFLPGKPLFSGKNTDFCLETVFSDRSVSVRKRRFCAEAPTKKSSNASLFNRATYGISPYLQVLLLPEQPVHQPSGNKILGLVPHTVCILILLNILATAGSAAGPGGRPAPPGLLKGGKNKFTNGGIQNPVWSHDGGKVAFVLWFGGNADVFVADAKGESVINITRNPAQDIYPVWSPDSQTVYFTSWRNGSADICMASADGKVSKCLTKTQPGESMYDRSKAVISPDGNTIAYCSFKKGYPQVYFMGRDGSNPREYFEQESCYPAWSPDGKYISLVSRHQLIVVDLKTGKRKWLTKELIDAQWEEDTWPVWSPKGNRLAFIARYQAFSTEIFTISAGGKKIRRITDNLFEDFQPAWKPDGKEVVYASYVAGDNTEIFVSDQDSPKKRRLTTNHDVEMDPSFSPDGARILYVRRVGAGETEVLGDTLYLMDPDGKNQRPFFRDPGLLARVAGQMNRK